MNLYKTVSSVFTAGRIGRWPFLLQFSNHLGDGPPPLRGDFLGEDYGLFGRESIYFFCESKKCSFFFLRIGPTPFEKYGPHRLETPLITVNL